ncbi:hypothetical protein F4679DRAFT_593164 [Xylaria curta]|nr:hypothetical protein F4679DRAFT_593164 [Xylaria curta]
MADKISMNAKLSNHFERDRRNEYDVVQVLLVYWEKSDSEGFKEEAEQLDELFRNTFRYSVKHFAIPPLDSHLALDAAVGAFLQGFSLSKSLGIIHYGGHGDEDYVGSKERRSVWASHGQIGAVGESILTWSDIQPKLRHTQADILLLLDCCFAAQVARDRESRRIIPENVEVLAACAMNLSTPSPSREAQTFTKALTKEFRDCLDEKRPVVIRDVHHQLSTKKAIITPRALLTFQVSLNSSPTQQLLDDITSWLTLDAPRDISGITVTDLVDQVLRMRDFIDRRSRSHNSVVQFDTLQSQSQTEIRGAWDQFLDRLRVSSRSMVSGTVPSVNNALQSLQSQSQSPSLEDQKVVSFLKDFQDNMETVRNVVSRNILLAPELFDRNSIEAMATDPISRTMGLAEALAIRLVDCGGTPPCPTRVNLSPSDSPNCSYDSLSSLSLETLPNFGQVLVEHRSFDRDCAPNLVSVNEDRVKRLVSALQKAGVNEFRTLECLGFTPDLARDRISMIFKTPVSSSPVTLYQIIQSLNSKATRKEFSRPTLGQRFKLALTIGRAMLQWHITGWVHQSIASYNVLFFKLHGGDVDYSNPYLVGFEYAREYDHTSIARLVPHPKDAIHQLYKHPDRQGHPPIKSHKRYHDIYSFGLVLFEIGLWSLVGDAFSKTVTQKGLDKIKDEVTRKTKGLICHEMGLAYETAVLLCLEGGFGIIQDDEKGSQLARCFDQQVLGRLEVGSHVDRVDFP